MTGNASESVIDLYRRHAAQWDAARRSSAWNDRIWIDTFAKKLARGSRVLDLGCGGGEPVARLLVEHGMHVTGVDASPEMIPRAQARSPSRTSPSIMRASRQLSTELWLMVAASRSFAMPRTTCGAVAERLGCADANGSVDLSFRRTLAIANRRPPLPPWVRGRNRYRDSPLRGVRCRWRRNWGEHR
jgi:SAM-dependent methyltransferase